MISDYWEVVQKKTDILHRACPPHPPPPHYSQLFGFFCVRLDYDYMYSETDFTQEIKTKQQKSPFLLTACCCSVTKWLDSGIAEVSRT